MSRNATLRAIQSQRDLAKNKIKRKGQQKPIKSMKKEGK